MGIICPLSALDCHSNQVSRHSKNLVRNIKTLRQRCGLNSEITTAPFFFPALWSVVEIYITPGPALENVYGKIWQIQVLRVYLPSCPANLAVTLISLFVNSEVRQL